jgi:peptidoglycan/LPS O-acetylase OafA/YrhL
MTGNESKSGEGTAGRPYFDRIDALRTVAIAFVLVEHFAPAVGHRITAGYYGVDLFFVISGFLITNILISSRKTFLRAYRDFVGRRTLRIFPIYYLTLAFLFAVGYQPCRDSILSLATYTYNYAWVHEQLPTSALSHFWSLAVEEQFYLFWPLFILSFRRWPRLLFAAVVVIAGVCYFQLTVSWFDAVTPYNLVGLFPRAGSLCLGALGSMLHRQKLIPDKVFENRPLELIVFAGLGFTLLVHYKLMYLTFGLSSLYLVLKAARSGFSLRWIESFLTSKRVVRFGTLSYGIYVYHLPIGHYVVYRLVAPWWLAIDFQSLGAFAFLKDCLWVALLPVLSLLSYWVADLSNEFIERPILSLKDRWFR